VTITYDRVNLLSRSVLQPFLHGNALKCKLISHSAPDVLLESSLCMCMCACVFIYACMLLSNVVFNMFTKMLKDQEVKYYC
jgi:hypothetical protein